MEGIKASEVDFDMQQTNRQWHCKAYHRPSGLSSQATQNTEEHARALATFYLDMKVRGEWQYVSG